LHLGGKGEKGNSPLLFIFGKGEKKGHTDCMHEVVKGCIFTIKGGGKGKREGGRPLGTARGGRVQGKKRDRLPLMRSQGRCCYCRIRKRKIKKEVPINFTGEGKGGRSFYGGKLCSKFMPVKRREVVKLARKQEGEKNIIISLAA